MKDVDIKGIKVNLAKEGILAYYVEPWINVWITLDGRSSSIISVDLDLFLEIGANGSFYKRVILNNLDPQTSWIIWATPLGKSIMGANET